VEREALVSGLVHPGDREPAPGSLALVQAFVNTVDREHGPDLLDDVGGLEEWLGRRMLPAAVGPGDLERARELREALRALLLANNGEPRDPAAQETLERAAAFTAMLDGSWARLKACPREICGWAFYDRSTNASATWCSMRVCGGRVKAGAYYRRRRAAGH
jgi:hypothetical protein